MSYNRILNISCLALLLISIFDDVSDDFNR